MFRQFMARVSINVAQFSSLSKQSLSPEPMASDFFIRAWVPHELQLLLQYSWAPILRQFIALVLIRMAQLSSLSWQSTSSSLEFFSIWAAWVTPKKHLFAMNVAACLKLSSSFCCRTVPYLQVPRQQMLICKISSLFLCQSCHQFNWWLFFCNLCLLKDLQFLQRNIYFDLKVWVRSSCCFMRDRDSPHVFLSSNSNLQRLQLSGWL